MRETRCHRYSGSFMQQINAITFQFSIEHVEIFFNKYMNATKRAFA